MGNYCFLIFFRVDDDDDDTETENQKDETLYKASDNFIV